MTGRRLADLRTALAGLDSAPGELVRVREEIPARFGVGARYARWAGTPAAPPTGPGPVVLFEHVRADSGASGPVLMGLYGTRRRAAALLGLEPAEVPFRLLEAVGKPVAPVLLAEDSRPERAARPADLTALPIPVLTDADAGPYLTLGAVLATDPDTGVRNLSVHRMCVQGPDTLTIWMVPGRDLERAYNAALARGESLPVAIHLGVPPAVLLASCCPSSLVPPEVDEIAVAGAIGGAPVELMPCGSIDAECIAHAEYVIEGEILDKVVPENPAGPFATPEFLGYRGRAHPALPVIRVSAITARPGAILQSVSGPGLEQSVLLGYGMEAAVLAFLRERGAPIVSALCHTAGGGQLMLVLRWRKRSGEDDALVRDCCEAVLETFRMVKTVLAVDEDVDPESDQDLWWAMATRLQADRDITILPDREGFALDPSQSTVYSPNLSGDGRTAKAVFDCTVPFALRDRFTRAEFTPEPAGGARRQAARRPR
ncbi:Carboxylyase-related protein [Catenulispora acidiphila DSM 44928]|uniref:Carboxylyase-related protein n=1 Tax=Catenulispora acidiphila (strain DSM 44928 / JCM 14897 / NBRC 102108 / NRRL B-24433 / ID139908) TaxID=479433 RepID=C7QBW2_CATAD|nr:UbiD family decarboxylase [Catenulispora acidiphila]ACU72581.1 Carboxylyase-related protein [Catenulispora acidiphila DSM 44928]